MLYFNCVEFEKSNGPTLSDGTPLKFQRALHYSISNDEAGGRSVGQLDTESKER
jgi:hypothetical protein